MCIRDRLNTLSAAIIRPQLDELPRRVANGRRNHDHVATQLNHSPWLQVPEKLGPEERAPDSIQFNLVGMSDTQINDFVATTAADGMKVQVFGQSTDNARAFWNWQFIERMPQLPRTRAMLMRACDVRLPAQLSLDDCDIIAQIVVNAVEQVMTPELAIA